VAGVPVAVVIKAAGLFEDAGELHAARAHVVNVSLGVLVAVFKGALLLGLAPKVRAGLATIVVAVGVEGRVNVNQIHAGIGQLGELFQIVAAINDAGVEERGGLGGTPPHPGPLPVRRGEGGRRPGEGFRAGKLFCHARSLRGNFGRVNFWKSRARLHLKFQGEVEWTGQAADAVSNRHIVRPAIAALPLAAHRHPPCGGQKKSRRSNPAAGCMQNQNGDLFFPAHDGEQAEQTHAGHGQRGGFGSGSNRQVGQYRRTGNGSPHIGIKTN